MRTRLRQELTAAMRARDRIATGALRSALAAIDNAEAVPVDESDPAAPSAIAGAGVGLGSTERARRELTEDEVRAIVAEEARQRTAAADEHDRAKHPEQAERLRAEADALLRCLRSAHA